MRFLNIVLFTILNGVSTPVLKALGQIVPIYPIILLRGLLSLGIFKHIMLQNEQKHKSTEKYYIAIVVLGVIGFFTYYTALSLVDVGLIVIFTINGTMIITLVLASIILKEYYSKIQWLLILISLICLTFISIDTLKVDFNIGIVLLFINAIVNSIVAIITRKLLEVRCSNEVSFVKTSVDVALCTVMLVLTPTILHDFIDKMELWLVPVIIYLAINSVILSILYNSSIIKIGVGLTDIIKNLTVVVTIVIGVVFMQDTYTKMQICMIILFIVSTFLIVVTNKKVKNQHRR